MVRNPVEVFERYRQSLGPTFSFHFGGTRRTLVSSDPEFLQQVLKQKRENYPKSDIQTRRMVDFQGSGLVNIHGQEWLRQRRLLARGFTPQRLSAILPVLNAVLTKQLERFAEEAEQGPIDIHRQMVRITLAMVGVSIFGRSMSEAELETIADTISTIQGFMVRQIVQPYLIPWLRISGQFERHQQLRREADRLVLRHVAARREAGTEDLDLLRILLEEPYPDSGEPMPEAQARIEALQLLVAGNETSSIALTWTFYLLARHPEHVERIRSEIDRVIGPRSICYDDLQALDYTHRVVNEVLRLFPPFWMIDRVALADDVIQGIHVPADTLVVPYIYGTHRNPDVWDSPETFDPARFGPGRSEGRHPFGYIPFGGGPRVCIGNRMALTQILLIVSTCLRRFNLAQVDPEPVGVRPMMLLRPDGPVLLRFERR